MKIGVLALQGDFAEHQAILEKLGAEVMQVRLPEHLAGLNALIIPGGESTTIGKLAINYGFIGPLQEFGKNHAIWGTCAGAIFLSKDIHREQPLLELMDISIERNAFGRQVDSFEIDLDVPCLDEMDHHKKLFHAIFIRAPLIETIYGNAQELARLPDNALKGHGKIVAAQQGKLLATSFHPELSDDWRFHRYFMEMAR